MIKLVSIGVCAFGLLVVSGCAETEKKEEASAKAMPINCANAPGDLRVLNSEKASTASKIGNGVSMIAAYRPRRRTGDRNGIDQVSGYYRRVQQGARHQNCPDQGSLPGGSSRLKQSIARAREPKARRHRFRPVTLTRRSTLPARQSPQYPVILSEQGRRLPPALPRFVRRLTRSHTCRRGATGRPGAHDGFGQIIICRARVCAALRHPSLDVWIARAGAPRRASAPVRVTTRLASSSASSATE